MEIKDIQNLCNVYPGVAWAKDKNHQFIASTKQTLDVVGIKKLDNLLGITDYDLPCKLSELADDWETQESGLLTSKSSIKVMTYANWSSNESSCLLAEKNVLTNKDGDVTGLYCITMEMPQSRVMPYMMMSIPDSKIMKNGQLTIVLEDHYRGLTILKRETQTLFYLLRGNTAKEIAQRLNISPKTVETHIQNIKLKAGCLSKNELVEKCISEGLIHIVPEYILYDM